MKKRWMALGAVLLGMLTYSCDTPTGSEPEKPAAPVYYTISYYKNMKLDEEPLASFRVQEGKKIEAVYRAAEPAWSGYRFKGWYEAEAVQDKYGGPDKYFEYDPSTPFDFDTAVAGDVSLYALWTNAVTVGANDDYYRVERIFEIIMAGVPEDSWMRKYYRNKDGDLVYFIKTYDGYPPSVSTYEFGYSVRLREPVVFTLLDYQFEFTRQVAFKTNILKGKTGFEDGHLLKNGTAVEYDMYLDHEGTDRWLPEFDSKQFSGNHLTPDDLPEDDGNFWYVRYNDIAQIMNYFKQEPKRFSKMNFTTYGIDRVEMADMGSIVPAGTYYATDRPFD